MQMQCLSCTEFRLAVPCCSSMQPGRRDHGIDFPWGIFCMNAIGAASVLIAGFYALVVPCCPWPVTAVVSLLHAVGISLYGWLLRADVVDIHSRKRTQAPAEGTTPEFTGSNVARPAGEACRRGRMPVCSVSLCPSHPQASDGAGTVRAT